MTSPEQRLREAAKQIRIAREDLGPDVPGARVRADRCAGLAKARYLTLGVAQDLERDRQLSDDTEVGP